MIFFKTPFKGCRFALRATLFGIVIFSVIAVCTGKETEKTSAISLSEPQVEANDSIDDTELIIGALESLTEADSLSRYNHLTEEDFELVAKELNVEVAAIKAIVVVEAGAAMKGFFAPGVPVINFDPTMYAKYKNLAPSKQGDKNAKVPSGLSGYALKEWTQLTNARKNNAQGADMGTFWGMFQIGGFNYKICGCESVAEFVERMSYSELEQLQLFAVFIENTGMIQYLRKKDWSGFSRRYNGPSYARRGYHTKMAKAYAKFSKK